MKAKGELEMDIEKALEKQIPKEPLKRPPLKQLGICPSCNNNINIRIAVEYCCYCGQKIAWRKTDE